MVFILLLTFVGVSQGLAIHNTTEDLPQPDLRVLTALYPPALQVEWQPVEYADPNEPILGYKVQVWEIPPVKTYKYVERGGKMTLIEETKTPEIGKAATHPEENAIEIVVNGALSSKAKVSDIKLNVIYEVRVRAYSARRDGPLSTHMRVQLMQKEDMADNEVYHFI